MTDAVDWGDFDENDVDWSMPFNANWGGRCCECDERYEMDDRIRGNGEGGYAHEDCVED